MRYGFLFSLGSMALAFEVAAQSAVDVARPEQRQKERRAVEKAQEKRAKQASIIEFRGEQAFGEKDLRTALKEEITTVEDFGLSPARADDLAFFLEVFYRKHGYADVTCTTRLNRRIGCASISQKAPVTRCGRSFSMEMCGSRATNFLSTLLAPRGSGTQGQRKSCLLLPLTCRKERTWCIVSISPTVFWMRWSMRRVTRFTGRAVKWM